MFQTIIRLLHQNHVKRRSSLADVGGGSFLYEVKYQQSKLLISPIVLLEVPHKPKAIQKSRKFRMELISASDQQAKQ